MISPLLVLERAVDVSRRLDAAGVGHALGGALALAYHVGDVRATADIDLNVTADPDRGDELFRLLPSSVTWTARDVEAVARDGQVRLAWPVPGSTVAVPLDLFFPQHAFHAVVAARVERHPMLDATVPVITATDLTVFKALYDRSKDWPDIEEMMRFGKVDLAEAVTWVERIVGAGDERVSRLRAMGALSQRPARNPTSAKIFGPR